MDKFLIWLLDNRDSASILVYLLLDVVFHGYALYKEWLVLGKPWARLLKSHEAMTELLDKTQDQLADQRVLNERAATTIDFLRSQIADLKQELAVERAKRTPRARN